MRTTVEAYYVALDRGDGRGTCSRVTEYVAGRMAVDFVGIAQDFGDLQGVKPGELTCEEAIDRTHVSAGIGDHVFTVEAVTIDGDEATASIIGTDSEIELVRDGAAWRISDLGGPAGSY